ncbi:MAG: signal recognition particle-docking protein FtsY [Burkholderiales bacterium]
MFSLFKSKPEPPTAPAGLEVAPATDASAPPRSGWADRLKAGLARTRNQLAAAFIGLKVDDALFEELEMALIAADCGVEASAHLIEALRRKANLERIEDGETLKRALADLVAETLGPLERRMDLERARPLTVMISGVNGVGKTTSIGKLAKYFQGRGKSVLLAAGDTFRAAAREQLVVWGERNGIEVISHGGATGDTAAVIFDAVNAARARGIDVLMADTAGRLPTQTHLMDEIRKVKRTISKADASAPHEVLLVIDANTGQNAVAQVKAFDDALKLTGLIVTKLDGTAKGGVLCAIARARPVPILFIGVGEGIDDLRPFVAREFADAMLGLD